MRVKQAIGLVATLVLAAGCGSDPKPAAGAKYTDQDLAVAAIASAVSDVSATQAHCTAEALVKAVGVQELQSAGVLNAEYVARLGGGFDAGTAAAIADATLKCWDWKKRAQDIAANYPDAEPDAWDKYVACTSKLNDQLRTYVIAVQSRGGKPSAVVAFNNAVDDCATTAKLGKAR